VEVSVYQTNVSGSVMFGERNGEVDWNAILESND
jgi:hypothetical protein